MPYRSTPRREETLGGRNRTLRFGPRWVGTRRRHFRPSALKDMRQGLSGIGRSRPCRTTDQEVGGSGPSGPASPPRVSRSPLSRVKSVERVRSSSTGKRSPYVGASGSTVGFALSRPPEWHLPLGRPPNSAGYRAGPGATLRMRCDTESDFSVADHVYGERREVTGGVVAQPLGMATLSSRVLLAHPTGRRNVTSEIVCPHVCSGTSACSMWR
jgi:hypothetical protein